MARIGFIGLGNMGGPMAANLVKAGHAVTGFDVAAPAIERLATAGGTGAASAMEAARNAEVLITMLPAGEHVRAVLLDEGALDALAPGSLLIDCSTIDVATARDMAAEAARRRVEMLDAPVSGGTAGAAAATLTFMVGGSEEGFARAEPLLSAMGRAVIHAGAAGAGQAAKICNNMILGVSMIAVCEAFALADRLGLDRQKLFDISSKSSGQCWSLTSYCPVPGPVPTSPANRDYAPGFTAAMMLKDLNLAAAAAAGSGLTLPLGSEARSVYEDFCNAGGRGKDFSGVFRFISDEFDEKTS